jgi:PAS domain S-box-containing protein
VLVGEVDTLIAAAPRARRTLKRRLLDIEELARFYPPDQEGQDRLRDLIDRLQVAIFAVDAEGHCIAASQGATRLTGYSRGQWLGTSVCDAALPGGPLDDARWRVVLAACHDAGTTTITTRAGEHLPVHAAAVAELLPGVHVAAFSAR